MVKIVCPTCGQEFDSEKGMRIHHGHVHDRKLPNRDCRQCGSLFYSQHEQKYCSQECRDTAVTFSGAENPNYSGQLESGTCRLCSEQFEYYPSEKDGEFCPDCVDSEDWQTPPVVTGSDNSQWCGGKQSVSCTVCGTTVERWPSEIHETTLCGEDCQAEWLSDSFRGTGHPNWNGGGNIEYGPGWRTVRKQALERDNWSCRVCETTRDDLGRNPDVHHIQPVRWFANSPDHEITDAHTLENVIALCSSCHRRAEFGTIPSSELRQKISNSDD